MATTNVPAIQFTPTGVVLPTEAAILAGVQADMNAAAGGNLSTTLTSPMGQQAQSDTAIIGDKNNQIAYLVAQVDPDNASGNFQDAIGRFYFLTRIAASGSVVSATIAGLGGATVPAGSLAQDTSGYLWALLADTVIPPSGNVAAEFQCQTTGPIALAPGALTTIYKAVTGWESISNASAAVVGTNVESRANFEYRRKNSVALNAVNSVQAILANVLSVPNVLDAYVIDNPTNAAVLVGSSNYSVAANSVYVAVVGGAAAGVALAIWQKKSLGCSYNGNTTYTVTDTANPAQPTYLVRWETPTAVPVYVTVNLANNSNLPSNIITLVQNAVLSAFNGTDGGSRSHIGSTTYSGRFYAGIYAIDPHVNVLSLTLGTAPTPTGSSLTMGIDQSPTLTAANIVVTLT